MKLTLIGYGAFGSVLSKILMENGNELYFYDPIKFPNIPLKEALSFGSAVVFSAPSATLKNLIRHFDEGTLSRPFILASKGFTSLKPFEKFKNFSIISGPSFSEDLKNEIPTTLTTTSIATKRLFERPYISFEISHDKLGILLCASLKNIYAIYAGYHHILPSTPTFRAFLIEATNEFKEILKANHSKPETVNLSCGFRDLAITSCSKKSRNYSFGYDLRKGKAKKVATIEGLSAYKSLKNSIKTSEITIPKDLPIFEEIETLLN